MKRHPKARKHEPNLHVSTSMGLVEWSVNFLSAIFGIFGKFWVDIGKNYFFQKLFKTKKFSRNKNSDFFFRFSEKCSTFSIEKNWSKKSIDFFIENFVVSTNKNFRPKFFDQKKSTKNIRSKFFKIFKNVDIFSENFRKMFSRKFLVLKNFRKKYCPPMSIANFPRNPKIALRKSTYHNS